MDQCRPPQLDRIVDGIDAGEHAQALASLLQLVKRGHPHPDVTFALADLLVRMGRFDQAELHARRGVAANPSSPVVHHALGNVLMSSNHLDEAISVLERAATLAPRSTGVRQSLGVAVRRGRGVFAAANVLRRALQECGEDAPLLVNLAHALHSIGRVEEAWPLITRAASLEPRHVLIADGACAMSCYVPGVDARTQHAVATRFGALVRLGTGAVEACPRWPLLAGRRLRIGLLSPDLREHAVGHLIRALIEHADRGRAEIACFYVGSHEDEMSSRLKGSADQWFHVPHLSAKDLATLIQRERIHILVDLAGHTASHRLRAMAFRPAPLQATYMGYPNTTGLDCVDLRISDAEADPFDTGEFNTESLAHLPGCFLSFRPPEWLPPVTRPPASRGEPLTFGCFGSALKQNGPLYDLWARVLHATPGSRLLLKNASLREDDARKHLISLFASRGVDGSRLLIEPPGASARELFPHYSRVDISLDTFPYTGTTTLCESLIMGVPVVSLSGETSPSRVSRSILGSIGRADLVAHTADEYVESARRLAGDVALLNALRTDLRDRFLRSGICDGPGFARRFVDLLHAEWLKRQ